MALTAAQYRTMRDLFRGRLSVDSANPSDTDVLSFFKQFLVDAVGSSALTNDQQAKAGRIANEVLSGNFSNPSDVNVVDFWTALAADANAGSAMSSTSTQYQTMKKAMVGMFSCDFFNPTIASVLSYINFFGLSFSGDFGALFTGYGLTVRSYRRGDLGVTGTTGAGKTNWANQSGDGSTMAPGSAASTDGIGSVGTGLNGRASVVTNGTTQNGSYTHPSGPAPGTTNHHIYAVERVLVTPVSVGYMHSANSNPVVFVAGGQSSPAAEMIFSNGINSANSSGVVINQWYRLSASWTDTTADELRVGAHIVTGTDTGAGAVGTQWGFGAAYNGSVLVSLETVLLMHIEGPRATFVTARTDADAKVRTFWTTAIEI
jgi:hypothetical protein